ncbi:hypothetical protein EXU48_05495 [Occultella glacieicola]|uniref:DUF1700 domain-containing protein n=1 Tax=Occultella glacieicola TaxID=2518684 RepID=A0ABY2E9H1_9MICO|nr:hypothetical protein [Occultella glacieicola]TDE97628.1 hypothetical protein EXU48_05495 [Occultella glacieicola]
MTTTTLSLADRWRRFTYVQTVELFLDAMPRRRRRAVLAELRENIDAATADVGLPTALADLGRPSDLAARYLESEPPDRPTWHIGALAASIVFAAWLLGTVVYTFGMLDALLALSPATSVAEGSFFGVGIRAEAGPEVLAAEFRGVSWPAVVAMVVIFGLFSRLWRVLPGARRVS